MKNVDQTEIKKFNKFAASWWDKQGDMKPLHDMNPVRMGFIRDHAKLGGANVIDIGCGGGILAESLKQEAASVTAVDMSEEALAVAKLHAIESALEIHYKQATAEEVAKETPAQFDVVTCMEMLEHVPAPEGVVKACVDLVKPGGSLFFSTINRNPKAYMMAIVGAEYVLRLLPKGTHEYEKFIKPSELETWLRNNSCSVKRIAGLRYNPLTKQFSINDDVSVNYLLYATKS